mmetsp:Transcript_40304/g.62919  ORF Transcript_40304/g.62919 Transcript_40304/m.62919 type:complete len:103 (+) Transcript_40304:1064-1372(+)
MTTNSGVANLHNPVPSANHSGATETESNARRPQVFTATPTQESPGQARSRDGCLGQSLCSTASPSKQATNQVNSPTKPRIPGTPPTAFYQTKIRGKQQDWQS